MSNKLLDALQSLFKIRNAVPFDPSSLQDPLALKTRWDALCHGGCNFKTHSLVQISPGRMEFKPTLSACFFYFIFILVGAGLLSIFPLLHFFNHEIPASERTPLYVAMGIGTVFLSIGLFMAYSGTKPIVFDQMRMLFWQGRPKDGGMIRKESFNKACELSSIHALQLIAEYCRGNKSSYYSYELNLILNDGSRMNVVDHGSLRALKADAARLGNFLNVPVWDAT